MIRYVVESIGYNDGHPYPCFSTSSLEEATHYLHEYHKNFPKVSHRLIEVIDVLEPTN